MYRFAIFTITAKTLVYIFIYHQQHHHPLLQIQNVTRRVSNSKTPRQTIQPRLSSHFSSRSYSRILGFPEGKCREENPTCRRQYTNLFYTRVPSCVYYTASHLLPTTSFILLFIIFLFYSHCTLSYSHFRIFRVLLSLSARHSRKPTEQLVLLYLFFSVILATLFYLHFFFLFHISFTFFDTICTSSIFFIYSPATGSRHDFRINNPPFKRHPRKSYSFFINHQKNSFICLDLVIYGDTLLFIIKKKFSIKLKIDNQSHISF